MTFSLSTSVVYWTNVGHIDHWDPLILSSKELRYSFWKKVKLNYIYIYKVCSLHSSTLNRENLFLFHSMQLFHISICLFLFFIFFPTRFKVFSSNIVFMFSAIILRRWWESCSTSQRLPVTSRSAINRNVCRNVAGASWGYLSLGFSDKLYSYMLNHQRERGKKFCLWKIHFLLQVFICHSSHSDFFIARWSDLLLLQNKDPSWQEMGDFFFSINPFHTKLLFPVKKKKKKKKSRCVHTDWTMLPLSAWSKSFSSSEAARGLHSCHVSGQWALWEAVAAS